MLHPTRRRRIRSRALFLGSVLGGASLGVLAQVALTGPASAQGVTAEGASFRLPDVVVTASRIEQPLNEVGSAISVITAEEIERDQLTTLDEVLVRLPGVNLPPRSAGGASGINLRGLGPRNTLVLIDGIEVADVSEAQVQYTLRRQIDAQNIDRVEVLRGPQSSLYGADASGGVINVITKKATRPLGADAYTEAGSHGSVRGGGAVEAVRDRLDARLSAFYHSEDGYSTASEGVEDDPQGAEGATLDLGYDVTTDLRLTGAVSVTQINQHFDSVNGVFDADFNRIGNTVGEERNDVTKMEYRARAGVEHLAFDRRLTSRFDLAFARNERDFAYYNPFSDPDAFIDSYDGTKYKAAYQGSLGLSDDHELLFGAESEYATLAQDTPAVSPTPIVKEDTRNDAGYLGYSGTFFDALTVSVTGRVDHDVDFGNEVTYRTAAAYRIAATGTKLRGSYGTGFVAPSLYERFDPCIGNRDIRPETSEGYDVGIDQSLLGDRASASVTLFHVETDDQIDFVSLNQPQNPACGFAGQYQNVDRTESRGLEVEVAGEIAPGLVARANYTYTDAEDANTGADLRGIPEHRASGDVSWRFLETATVGLGVEYRSEVSTFTDVGDDVGDRYAIVSARASYDITPAVTAYARAENVLDRDYEEQPGYTAPGFAAYAGLRVRF